MTTTTGGIEWPFVRRADLGATVSPPTRTASEYRQPTGGGTEEPQTSLPQPKSPSPSESKEPPSSLIKVPVLRGEVEERRAKCHYQGNGAFVPGAVYDDTASLSELMKMRGYKKVDGQWI